MRTPNTPPSAMRKGGGMGEEGGAYRVGFFSCKAYCCIPWPGCTAQASAHSSVLTCFRTLTAYIDMASNRVHALAPYLAAHNRQIPKRVTKTPHASPLGGKYGTNRRRILLCAEEAKEKKYSSSTHPPGTMSTVFADPWETPPTAGMRTASLKVMYPRSDATPAFKRSPSSCSTPAKSTHRTTFSRSQPLLSASFLTPSQMSLCLDACASSGCAMPAQTWPFFSHSSLVYHGRSHRCEMNTTCAAPAASRTNQQPRGPSAGLGKRATRRGG
jgi:hypothetical protein